MSLGLENFDGLRLCSQIRSLDRTRNVPILAIADADNNTRLVRGLEIGVNDYLTRPIDKNELLARVRTQIRKKRYTERLRDNVQMSIEMAITDALTGLYNRRYMESHVGTLVEQAAARGKPLTVLVLDIDYFKSINDTSRPRRRRRRAARVRDPHPEIDPRHRSRLPLRRRGVRGGHAGDRSGGRHHGGGAAAPAHRQRAVPDPAGRAQHRGHDLDRDRRARRATTMPASVIKRADQALYRAKRDGRNRVVPDAA